MNGLRGDIIISSVTLTKVGVILRLFPPPNTYRTPCTHDMLWVKKHRIFHSLNESNISSCYQTHILSEDGKPSLRILRPTQPHQPRMLHARYVLDQEWKNVHSLNAVTTSSCHQTLKISPHAHASCEEL